MKTLKYFMGALALCSMVFVSCGPREEQNPSIVNPNDTTSTGGNETSDMPEVAATEGAVTVVWNIVDAEVCSGLVFAGDYNGYNTDPAAMAHFEAIEGHEGWYKAVITPADASLTPVLAGKPCALAKDGTFPSSWDHQWINVDDDHQCQIISGDAELQVEYDVESKLLVTNNSSVVYVRSYGFKVNPCVEEVYDDVTFNLHVTLPVEGGDVYIVGDAFEVQWDPAAYKMNKVDANNWTVTLPAVLGKSYKYVVNGSWDNDQMQAPAEGKDCSEAAGNMTLDFNLMEDEVYGFLNYGATKCEETPAE